MTDRKELVERLRYGIRDVETGEPLDDGAFGHVSAGDIREALAALAPVEAPRVTEAACMDCGLAYGDDRFPDLVVPNDTWQIIAPDDGLLCPNCLCGRAAKLGIECQATFRSGPFNAQTPPEGAVTEAQGWLPIESAPKDGTPFIVRYLPFLGGTLCMRRVRWVHDSDNSVRMEDMGAWLFIKGVDDDFQRMPTSGEPLWSIAADDLNDTTAWVWTPLPTPPVNQSEGADRG